MPSVLGCFIRKRNGSSSRSDRSDVPADNDETVASSLALFAKRAAFHQVDGRRRAAHGDARSTGSASSVGAALTLLVRPLPAPQPPPQQGLQQQPQQEYPVEEASCTERITVSSQSTGPREHGCCHEGEAAGARLRAYFKAILTFARLERKGPAAVAAAVAVPQGQAAPAVEDRALRYNLAVADPLPVVAASVLPNPFLLSGGSFLRPSSEMEATPCQPIVSGNSSSQLSAVARASGLSITRYPAAHYGLLLSGSGTGSVSALGVGGGLPGASSIDQGIPKEALLNLSRFAGSTDRDDDLSTVGSLNSTTQHPLPLLGSKTSGLIVEEGGVGFTELMKGAAARNTGAAALSRSVMAADASGAKADAAVAGAELYLPSPPGAGGNPFDLSSIGDSGPGAFSALLGLGPSGWPPAVGVPILGCYRVALVDATSELQLAEDVSLAGRSPGLADGWVVGPNRASAASSLFLPGVQMSPMPRCRASWGRIRSCGVRGGITSLNQVPEEEPSAPRGSTDQLRKGGPPLSLVYSHIHSCHLGLGTQEEQEIRTQTRSAANCDIGANLPRPFCNLLAAAADAEVHAESRPHVCAVCGFAVVAGPKELCEGCKLSAVHLEAVLSTVYGIDEGDRWSPGDVSDAVGKQEVASGVGPECSGCVVGQIADRSGGGIGGTGEEVREDAGLTERPQLLSAAVLIQNGAAAAAAAAAGADSQQHVELRPPAAPTQDLRPSAAGPNAGDESPGGPDRDKLTVDPSAASSTGFALPAITMYGTTTEFDPRRVQAPSSGSDLVAEWAKGDQTTMVLRIPPGDGAADDADDANAVSPDGGGAAANIVDSRWTSGSSRRLMPDLCHCHSLRIRVHSDLQGSSGQLPHGSTKFQLDGERRSSYGATHGTTSIHPSSVSLGMMDTEPGRARLGRAASQMMSALTPEPGSPSDSLFASPVTRLASGCETPYTPYVCTQHPLQAMQVDPSEVVLGKLIGRGCAGRVYKGTFRGEVVAVKVITHCEAAAANGRNPAPLTEEQVKSLEKEAALAYVLKHPNIVATYAAFTRVSSPGPSTQPHSPAARASSLQPSGAATQTQFQGPLERSIAASRVTPYSSPTVGLPQGMPPPPLELNAAAVAAQPTRWYPSFPSCRGPLLLTGTSGAGGGGGSAPSPVTNGLSRCIWRMPSFSIRMWAGPGGSSGGEAVVNTPAGDGSVVAGSAAAAALDRSPRVVSGSAPTALSSSALLRPGGESGRSSSLCGALRSGPCRWEVYIVMELCPCGSLRAALDAKMLHNKKGVPHLHEVLPLAWEIACALHYLHANNVVHGDLKAANVMLAEAPSPPHSNLDHAASAARSGSGITSTGCPSLGLQQPSYRPTYTAKVADFSHSYQVELALRRLREGERNNGVDSAADGASELASPSHAAPELFEEGARHTFKSDIYALGVVLWELYSGRKPYDKYTVGEVLASKRTVPTADVLVIPDSWIPEYGKVCEQCWLPPAERPSLHAIVTTLILLCRTKLPHVQLSYPVAIDSDPDSAAAALDLTMSYDALGMPTGHLPGMVIDTAEVRPVAAGALTVGHPLRRGESDMAAAGVARGCGSNAASAANTSTCHRTMSCGVLQDNENDVVLERFRHGILVTNDNDLAATAAPTSASVLAPESAETNPYASPGDVSMSPLSSRAGTAEGALGSRPVYVPLPLMPFCPQQAVSGSGTAPSMCGLAMLRPEEDLAACSRYCEDPPRCSSQGSAAGPPASAGSAIPNGGGGGDGSGAGAGARACRRTAASSQDSLLSRLEPLPETESCHLRLPPEHTQGCIRTGGPGSAAGDPPPAPLDRPCSPIPSHPSAAANTSAIVTGSSRKESTIASLVPLEASPCVPPNAGPFASISAGGAPPQHRSCIGSPPVDIATAVRVSSTPANNASVATAADGVVGIPSVAVSGCTSYVVAPEESADAQQTLETATRPRSHGRILSVVFLDGPYSGAYGRFSSSACITEAGNGSAAVQAEHASGCFTAPRRTAAAVNAGTGAELRLGPVHGRGSSGASPWGAGRLRSGSLGPQGLQAGTGAGAKSFRSSTHSVVHGAISASSLPDGPFPGIGNNVAAAAATRVSVAASGGGGGLRSSFMPCSLHTISHTALCTSVERTSGLPPGLELPTIASCNDVSSIYGGAPGARSPAATLSGFFGISKLGRQHSRNFTTRELEAVWTSIPRFSDAPPSPLVDSYGGAP